jgi:hypothetical protein
LCEQEQISFIAFVNSKASTPALGAILPDLDGSINWERAEIKLSLHKQANAWNQPRRLSLCPSFLMGRLQK